jgi:hypothetical protein
LKKRKTSRYKKLTKHQTIRTNNKHPQIHHNQNKERILKAAKQIRQFLNKVKPIKIASDFSTQILKARRS